MTPTPTAPDIVSRLITAILGIKPVFNVAKRRARVMMVKRAARIGVDWPREVLALRSRQTIESLPPQQRSADLHPEWEQELADLRDNELVYPTYYLQSFHAYDEGNLGWLPAMEADVASKTVHAKIWDNSGVQGDTRLRQSYFEVVQATVPNHVQHILDIGCSAGHSTFGLRSLYPSSYCTGVELSPYFLTVAQYFEQQYFEQQTIEQQTIEQKPDTTTKSSVRQDSVPQNPVVRVGSRQSDQPQVSPRPIQWIHAAGEATGLRSQSFDLASISLVLHELPRTATQNMLVEMRRVLKPGGYLAIMDMNPKAAVYAAMPPYILTLLKSTEPFLDDYFTLDLEQAIYDAGFTRPTVTCNSPRHRTLIAQVR